MPPSSNCIVERCPSSAAGAANTGDLQQCNSERCPLSFNAEPHRTFYRRDLPSELVDLTSTDGKSRFASSFASGYAEAFFPLVSQYQTQSHPALCGLTTLTIMLNALGIDPARVWQHPWRWFAEKLLDCCIDIDTAKLAGVTMDQLRCTGVCNGAEIEIIRGLELEPARELLRNALRNSDEFVAVSYYRKTLGQTGSGHFSPIAAYDEATDSVLILDTARFKYGPYWVDLQQLHNATLPVDPASGKSRGYMTFKRAKQSVKCE